ncbi:MAG TPA: hypothetical protein PK098_08410 [Phycisphaerales bacterium]|nr:hypothetical protein [Phycisphaerales bacterium]
MHINSADDADIDKAIASPELIVDKIRTRSRFHGMAWGESRHRFAMQAVDLSQPHRFPPVRDARGMLQFPMSTIVCGRAETFAWEGAGNNIVEIRSNDDPEPTFGARLRYWQELYDYVNDPEAAFLDFASRFGVAEVTRTTLAPVDGNTVERLSFTTPDETFIGILVLTRDPETGAATAWQHRRINRRDHFAIVRMATTQPGTPRLLPALPEQLPDAYSNVEGAMPWDDLTDASTAAESVVHTARPAWPVRLGAAGVFILVLFLMVHKRSPKC